jgi:hypothetical protein
MEMSKKILGAAVLLVAGLSQSSAYAASCTDSKTTGHVVLNCYTSSVWATSDKDFRVTASAYNIKNDGSRVNRQGTYIIVKKRDWQLDVTVYEKTFTAPLDMTVLNGSGQANYFARTSVGNIGSVTGIKSVHVSAGITVF